MCPLLERPTRHTPLPYGRGGYQIVQCEETGLVHLQNPPDYDTLREDFPWEESSLAESERRRRAEPLVSRVSTAIKSLKRRYRSGRNRPYRVAARALGADHRRLRLLDIGCGSGGLLADCCRRFEAAGSPVTPVGIELSPALADATVTRLAAWSGEVIADTATDGVLRLEDSSIDATLMISFLEHEVQPLTLLRRLAPKLAPGGLVVVKVPNFASLNRRVRGRRWSGFRFPDHVSYFTPATLRRLAAEAGYAVDPGSWRDRAPTSDNMYAVLRPRAAARIAAAA